MPCRRGPGPGPYAARRQRRALADPLRHHPQHSRSRQSSHPAVPAPAGVSHNPRPATSFGGYASAATRSCASSPTCAFPATTTTPNATFACPSSSRKSPVVSAPIPAPGTLPLSAPTSQRRSTGKRGSVSDERSACRDGRRTNAGRRRPWPSPNFVHPKSDGSHFGFREQWRRSGLRKQSVDIFNPSRPDLPGPLPNAPIGVAE